MWVSLIQVCIPYVLSGCRNQAVDLHHSHGLAYRKQGNYIAAIEEYTRALALDPNHFKSYFNRGFSYDKVREAQPITSFGVMLSLVSDNVTRCIEFAYPGWLHAMVCQHKAGMSSTAHAVMSVACFKVVTQCRLNTVHELTQ